MGAVLSATFSFHGNGNAKIMVETKVYCRCLFVEDPADAAFSNLPVSPRNKAQVRNVYFPKNNKITHVANADVQNANNICIIPALANPFLFFTDLEIQIRRKENVTLPLILLF